jgi:peroxiredoxin (alkyl hydroperoxide reductase subunit C)
MRVSNPDFAKRNTQVLGISTNAQPAQTAFAQSLGTIPYPILSDFHPNGQVAQAYGVYNEEGGTARRSIFVIDKQGVVRFKKLYSGMPEFDMGEILAEVDKL